MRIFRHWRNVPSKGRGAIVAIGNFDGVHLGHQAVISRAHSMAKDLDVPLGVLTFEPHPRKVLGCSTDPFRLTPFRVKLREIAGLGVDILYLARFDKEFASLTADHFIKDLLISGLSVSHVVVGYDFAFGKGRTGNYALLKSYANNGYFRVTQVDVSRSNLGIYSASQVRDFLKSGDVVSASTILGRLWEIEGRVQSGERRGRELGFPTANLPVAESMLPAFGVYAMWVEIQCKEGKQWWPAIGNLGSRPTFENSEILLEVHILDFSKEIYGKRLRTLFVKYIRSEQRFEGLDALKGQILKDISHARNILERSRSPDSNSSLNNTN